MNNKYIYIIATIIIASLLVYPSSASCGIAGKITKCIVKISNKLTKFESKLLKEGTIINFKNKKVVQSNNKIDPKKKDAKGQSNCDRMKKGLAPLGNDSKPMELHHSGQKDKGLIFEMTSTEHNSNSAELHAKKGESEIDRPAFDKWRSEYWKERAKGLCK